MAISKKNATIAIFVVYLNLAMFATISLGQKFDVNSCVNLEVPFKRPQCCNSLKMVATAFGPQPASMILCHSLLEGKNAHHVNDQIRQLYDIVLAVCHLPLQREITYCRDWNPTERCEKVKQVQDMDTSSSMQDASFEAKPDEEFLIRLNKSLQEQQY